MTNTGDIREDVKRHYGDAVKNAVAPKAKSCCAPTCCGGGTEAEKDPITRNLYSPDELGSVPSDAALASFGCGNPTALAELRPGEVVLDLGAGAGIDVLLSAKRVGPTGKAYGLDMTAEMLAVARKNVRESGATNVEILEGHIEAIPLPDASVDVIISNCVVNLSPDKDAVLREAYRVLKPGGRFAVSDIVVRRELPATLRRSIELWAGCVAGALLEQEYLDKLHAAGFAGATVEATRVYGRDDAEMIFGPAASWDAATRALVDTFEGAIFSGFVRATKPLAV